MPRLLSLNAYYYRRGGSTALLFEHESIFRERGWSTAVLSMRHPHNEASDWSRFFTEEVEVDGQYGVLERIRKAGKIIYSFEARRRLRDLLAAFPADIAHVHCIYHHLSPSVLPLLRERGVPVVLTAHDLKLACPAYKMLNRSGVCEKCRNGNLFNVVTNRCVRDSLPVSALVAVESVVHRLMGIYRRNVDRVIAPSRFYAHKLAEWGWPPEYIVYIPNCVAIDRFVPVYEPDDYFVYFGRLVVEKGVQTLIEAAREAKVELRIVGTGPEEARLKAVGERADGRIKFLGHLTGEPLWDLVRRARAVVLPSEWYENAPMSILEAYASGTAVIASAIGGIPELVEDGETGALFAPGSVSDLARCLREFKGMSVPRVISYGAAGRRRAERLYDRSAYLDAMLGVYRELGVAE